MVSLIASCVLGAAGASVAFYCLLRRNGSRRIEKLEAELQMMSEMLQQMTEMQVESFRKLSGNIHEMEERFLDLSVPTADAGMPVERRRRIVTLGSKGMAVEEISKKLQVSRAETELVLNLQKWRSGAPAQAEAMRKSKSNHPILPVQQGEIQAYVQA